jgi:DNA (cytosine-5)-methyltransferase 1
MSVTFASLYSGCGGFDLGFVQAGYVCTGAFDIDPLAVTVHRRNLKSPALVCDLRNEQSVISKLKADVLLAGSPCQGFSTAGKRHLEDPRNSLLVQGGRIAAATRVKVFVAENVAGVIAGEHKHYWDALHQTLRLAGYRTADLYCDAYKMGVPQRRRRMVLIGWLRDRDIDFDIPFVDGGVVSEAIKLVSGVPNHSATRVRADSPTALIAKHIGQGQKLSNVRGGPRSIHTWQIPEVYGPTTEREQVLLEVLIKLRRQNRVRGVGDADPVSADLISNCLGHNARKTLKSLIQKGYVRSVDGLFDLTHTFNGKYRRLLSNAPSPTVDTRFGDPKYFLHPTKDRGLTAREAARIQGFPDSFIFEGSNRAQHRMIGNAVPPPMARQIALFIRRTLEVR